MVGNSYEQRIYEIRGFDTSRARGYNSITLEIVWRW